MYEPPKQRWGCLQWAIVLVVCVLGWIFMTSSMTMISNQAPQMRGVNNCKQIILSLKQYSKDAESLYPDGKQPDLHSANQVFRELFKARIVTDERIFGCPNSVFAPDMSIGTAPDFAQALTPGECHWMLLKFQTDSSAGDTPIVVENALNASWPPKWNVADPSDNKRGRVWKGNKIIVGRNDGSVAVEKLRPDGTIDWRRMYNAGYGTKSWIDTLTPEQVAKMAYWDVEENSAPRITE